MFWEKEWVVILLNRAWETRLLYPSQFTIEKPQACTLKELLQKEWVRFRWPVLARNRITNLNMYAVLSETLTTPLSPAQQATRTRALSRLVPTTPPDASPQRGSSLPRCEVPRCGVTSYLVPSHPSGPLTQRGHTGIPCPAPPAHGLRCTHGKTRNNALFAFRLKGLKRPPCRSCCRHQVLWPKRGWGLFFQKAADLHPEGIVAKERVQYRWLVMLTLPECQCSGGWHHFCLKYG